MKPYRFSMIIVCRNRQDDLPVVPDRGVHEAEPHGGDEADLLLPHRARDGEGHRGAAEAAAVLRAIVRGERGRGGAHA